MRYLSGCSGIEAASVAWGPLGWKAYAVSEIEAFPCAVLKHHYPNTPNLGDMTKFKDWPDAAFDVLVGGTPCQSFSVAGLRKGLADPRGNLALTYLAIADKYRPEWLVWENVPGVFSSESHDPPDPCPPSYDLDVGRDGEEMEIEDEYDSEELHAFNCFLAGLSELGYGFAYRVLDAQYFGVPQRRRRVFVVGHLGDWRRAAAVLFERESLRGYSAPSRQTGEGFAPTIAPSLTNSGRGVERTGDSRGQDAVVAVPLGCAQVDSFVDEAFPLSEFSQANEDSRRRLPAPPLAFGGNNTAGEINLSTAVNAHGGPHGRLDFESETFITHSLRADGFDASEDGTGRGTPLVSVDVAPTLRAGGNETGGDRPYGTDVDTCDSLIAFSCKDHGADANALSPTLRAMGHSGSHANAGGQVAVAVALRGREGGATAELSDVPSALRASNGGGDKARVLTRSVRRLTPREYERLQGFPDDYTLVTYRGKPAADGPRYKALGNSMAVPVMRWIGERIDLVNAIASETHLQAAE